MEKMKKGECRCTVKDVEYCKTDEGVRFTGKCPPKKANPRSIG